MAKETTTATLQAVPTTGVPLGTVVPFFLSASSVPAGWLLCDGSPIPPQYQSLITALGSASTPNLAGRVLIGTGIPATGTQSDGTNPNFNAANNWPLGYTGGQYQDTLTLQQMPSHQHMGWGEHSDNPWGTGNSTGRNYYGAQGNDTDNYLYGSTFTGGNIPADKVVGTSNGTVTGLTAGSTSPHNLMQPYYAVNYIMYAGS